VHNGYRIPWLSGSATGLHDTGQEFYPGLKLKLFDFQEIDISKSFLENRKTLISGRDRTLDLYCAILSHYHSAMEFCSRCAQYGTSFTRLDELNRMALAENCPKISFFGLPLNFLEPCRDKLDHGRECENYTIRYHYEQKSKSCQGFFYTGCGTSQNNFPNLKECELV
jgi:hypothetical protein